MVLRSYVNHSKAHFSTRVLWMTVTKLVYNIPLGKGLAPLIFQLRIAVLFSGDSYGKEL